MKPGDHMPGEAAKTDANAVKFAKTCLKHTRAALARLTEEGLRALSTRVGGPGGDVVMGEDGGCARQVLGGGDSEAGSGAGGANGTGQVPGASGGTDRDDGLSASGGGYAVAPGRGGSEGGAGCSGGTSGERSVEGGMDVCVTRAEGDGVGCRLQGLLQALELSGGGRRSGCRHKGVAKRARGGLAS